ncbi:MAG: FtsQ-type POTRA domain-containing protein [Bryobacterales bacterium]|nr:cell division protein FtsQ/DivIB [Bryobacteraceae bacterium]MDW8356023.1 FtsQ-type POTRA domain-containing protein [Bryobacterales bacterium]
MGRRLAASGASRRRAILRALGFGTAALAFAGAVAWCYHRVDRFLATDERFVLAGPDGPHGPGVQIEGIRYAPRSDILQVFAADFGKSVYLAPLAERRRQLLAVDWVKDAAVERRWPRELRVRLVERQPVAFVRVPSRQATQVVLIDAEGVFLRLPARARFELPVLTGLLPQQSLPMRRVRVECALRVLKEVGPDLAARISELDVSDPDNVLITCTTQDQALALKVGAENFRARLENFFAHYAEIRRRLPQAAVFDLRLEDRIIAEEP